MRKLDWLGILTAAVALSIYASTPVTGQQQQAQAMPDRDVSRQLARALAG